MIENTVSGFSPRNVTDSLLHLRDELTLPCGNILTLYAAFTQLCGVSVSVYCNAFADLLPLSLRNIPPEHCLFRTGYLLTR